MATKTLLTLEEFERLPENGTLHELNEGELIESVHPKLRHGKIAHRIQNQHLDAGARIVWVVYPKTRKVHVHAPGRATVTLGENDSLEAPELFPGWSLKVSMIFASK